ncbi:hypothetical protein ACFO9Q_04905 [Paenibacillus sp. GCM10023252]|uniref:hypothetical protein n=1 Tax=Paenibacillus sp. GCM10023252 TaxID=3252649 RepID=UPI00360BC1A9
MIENGWIFLEELDDNYKIWAGTRVRLFGVGLNVKEKSEDYYEYLVSYIYDNNEYLQLTNLSRGEAGNIICVISKDIPNHYSLGKNLKKMLDTSMTYVLLD